MRFRLAFLISLLVLLCTAPASALVEGGGKNGCFWLDPNTYSTYRYFWYYGYAGGASVNAASGVDVDVYVYDDYSNLIVSGASASSYENVSWWPRINTWFTVKVVNSNTRYGTNVCLVLL